MFFKRIILFLLVFISCSGFAQIQHITNTFYDFDGDGTEDISVKDGYYYNSFENSEFYYISISTKDGIKLASAGEYGVSLMEFNYTINGNLTWTDKQLYITHGYIFPNSKWKNGIDYFIGIRILNNNSAYYGWIRVNKGSTRDAAIQLVPNVMIKAGEGIQSIAPILGEATDVYNHGDWSDIEVKFYLPYYSSFVKEYRIFVCKDGVDHNFSIDELLDLPDIKYQKFETGTLYYNDNIGLKPDMLDLDGDKMVFSKKYKVCVLSISNNPDKFRDAYSISSSVEINTALPEIGKPMARDINNLGTSKDLRVTFTTNSRKDMTKEYRLLIVPNDSTESFTLEKASFVPPENTRIIVPKESYIDTVEGENIIDIYGNEVEQNKMYNAFVYSVPDSVQSNIGSLSVASNPFCLGVPDYIYAGQKEGEKISYIGFDSYLSVGNSLKFDFDSDGEEDFTFTAEEVQFASRFVGDSRITTGVNTEIIITDDQVASNVSEYSSINNQSHWGSGTFIFASIGWVEAKGEFIQYPHEGIVGFRKLRTNDTIYGWIHINALRKARLIDYAWQIRTDKQNIALPDSIETTFISFPNPNIDRILNIAIKDFKNNEDYYVDVLNASGVKMKMFSIRQQLSKINLSDVPRGLYYFRLRSNDNQETQKVMLQ